MFTRRIVPVRFALSAVLIGSLASIASADPILKVEPIQIDLGVIQEGNLFERFLEVSNIGDGVLVIQDVKTSCGCTAVAVDGIVELEAGESQKIRVTFDSKNMDGGITKRVTISSNDPKMPKAVIKLIADVHKPIRWQPKYVSLNRVGVHDGFTDEVQLQSDTSLGLKVLGAQILGGALRNAPSKLFDIAARPMRVEGERDIFSFDVTLREGVRPQKISETIEIVTNQPAPNDTLKLAIRGEIAGRIRVVPNFAVLRMVEEGQETARDITLTATKGTFNVIRAEVADSSIQVETHPNENGRQTVIRLIYTGETPGTNGVRTLTIETDDPDQRLIEMSVRYQTRAAAPEAASANAIETSQSTKKSADQGPN